MAFAYKCDICGEIIADNDNGNPYFNFTFADMRIRLHAVKSDEDGCCDHKAVICKPCNAKFTKAVATALNEMYNESKVK